MAKLTIPAQELMYSGHSACPGCAPALAMRLLLKALGPRTVVSLPACCWTVIATPYPTTALAVGVFDNPIEATGASISGLRAAADAMGFHDLQIVGFAGDGGTADIGLQSLSGMLERRTNAIYVMYDNEGYMNTGVQRSGATPPAARTATTEAVGPEPGNVFGQGKDLPRLAVAHGIPYVATATVADLHDLEAKVHRAMSIHGARYLHVLVPCPLGWGSEPADTIKVARLAYETGLFPVYEAAYGQVLETSAIRRRQPVEMYLRLQRRFRHLFEPQRRDEVIDRLQEMADRNIEEYDLLDASDTEE
jgi:pyruvate ferredoxin oxidoreductase beta subunit